jgi:hypothetical protein
MALNFPSSPTIGQIYIDSTSGFSYEWDGTVWKSYSSSSTSQIKVLDDISASFDGITTSFPITSSGLAITPVNPASLRINLGGVIQDSSNDYTISGSNLIFSTPPVNGLSFSGISLGPAIPINTIEDGSVTPQKLSPNGPSWNTSGDLTVGGSASFSGIVTATNFVSTSDENLKDNIQTIDNALEKLSNIRGVSFEWKSDHTQSMGVIAQEVEKVFPSLVMNSDFKAVNYDGIIGVMIESIKELQERIDKLESHTTD